MGEEQVRDGTVETEEWFSARIALLECIACHELSGSGAIENYDCTNEDCEGWYEYVDRPCRILIKRR